MRKFLASPLLWAPLAVLFGALTLGLLSGAPDSERFEAQARVGVPEAELSNLGPSQLTGDSETDELIIAGSEAVRREARSRLEPGSPPQTDDRFFEVARDDRQGGVLVFSSSGDSAEEVIARANAGAQGYVSLRREEANAAISQQAEPLNERVGAGDEAAEQELGEILLRGQRLEEGLRVISPATAAEGGGTVWSLLVTRTVAAVTVAVGLFILAMVGLGGIRGRRPRRVERPDVAAGRDSSSAYPGAAETGGEGNRHGHSLASEETIEGGISEGISRQAAFVFGARAVVVLSTAVLTIYIARTLGPDKFGVYALALAIGTGLGLIADLGVINSTSRYAAEAANQGRPTGPALLAGLRIKIPANLVVFGALLGSANSIEGLFGIEGLAPALQVAAAVGFLEDIGNLVTKTLWSVRRASTTLALSVVRVLGEAAGAVALIAAGYGAAGALAGRGLGFVAALVLAALLLGRVISWGRGASERVRSKSVLRYGLHLWLAELAWVGFQAVDQVLLGALSGAAAVAQYEASWRIATVAGLVGLSISAAVAPRLAAGGRTATSERLVRQSLQRLLVFYIPLAGVLAIAAPALLPALLGEEFAPASDVLVVLAPFIALAGAAPLLSESIDYLGIGHVRKWLALAAVLTNLVLDLILIPRLGIIGPAIATDVAISIYVVGLFVICVRHLGIAVRPVGATALRTLLATAAGVGTAFLVSLRTGGILEVLAVLGSGAAVCLVGLLLLGELRTLFGEPRPGPLGKVAGLVDQASPRVFGSQGPREPVDPLPVIGAALLAALLGIAVGYSPLLALLLAVATVGILAVVVLRPSAPLVLLTLVPLAIPFSFLRIGPVPSNTILGAIVFVAVLAALTARPWRLRWVFPLAPAFAYLLWVVASAAWTVSLPLTLVHWAGLAVSLTFMAAVLVFVNSDRHLNALIIGLAFAAAAAAVANLIMPAGDALTSPDQVLLSGDRNFFSAFQVVAIPLILVLAARSRGWRRHLAWGVAALAAASVVASTSRAGVIALAVVAVAICMAPRGSLHPSGRARAGFIGLSTLLAIVAAVTLAGPVIDRFTDSEEGDSGRTNLLYAAQSALADEPLHGLGYGAFAAESAERQLADPRVDLVDDILRPRVEPHNAFLGSGAELGVPGMVLFSLVMLASLLAAASAFRRAPPGSLLAGSAVALAIGHIGWFVMAMTLSIEGGRLTWLIFGLSCALYAMARTPLQEREGPLPSRTSPSGELALRG